MTPTETLKAIRKICEGLELEDEPRTMGEWAEFQQDQTRRLDHIYILCLNALEPAKPEEAVQSYTLDEATIKAQRESWAKGDMD